MFVLSTKGACKIPLVLTDQVLDPAPNPSPFWFANYLPLKNNQPDVTFPQFWWLWRTSFPCILPQLLSPINSALFPVTPYTWAPKYICADTAVIILFCITSAGHHSLQQRTMSCLAWLNMKYNKSPGDLPHDLLSACYGQYGHCLRGLLPN